MKKIAVRVLLVGAAIFVVMQFFQPDRSNPPVDLAQRIEQHVTASPAVAHLLRNACFDCHSNETRWPWYSHVSPVSWLVSRDVSVGREHLNFSEWGSYKTRSQIGRLGAIAEEVEAGTMPLPIYISMHDEADLSAEERDSLAAWADTSREYLIQVEGRQNRPDPVE
ncbi:MAG: heme-binding domain-containing protein [Bacteroidota bacterium]